MLITDPQLYKDIGYGFKVLFAEITGLFLITFIILSTTLMTAFTVYEIITNYESFTTAILNSEYTILFCILALIYGGIVFYGAIQIGYSRYKSRQMAVWRVLSDDQADKPTQGP